MPYHTRGEGVVDSGNTTTHPFADIFQKKCCCIRDSSAEVATALTTFKAPFDRMEAKLDSELPYLAVRYSIDAYRSQEAAEPSSFDAL